MAFGTDRTYCPHWTWWIRSGEHLAIGLSLEKVLRNRPASATRSCRVGLERLSAHLAEGHGLAEAMRLSGMRLPLESWSLLEAAEVSGRTGEALREIGEALENRQRRRRELMGQLWYPGLVLLTGFAVSSLILLWVIPQMRVLSASMGMGEELPWITENIGILYGSLLGAAVFALGCGILAASALAEGSRRYPACARWREHLEQALPVAGRLLHQAREARLLRQLGTLLQAGIPLPEALRLIAAPSGSLHVRKALETFRSSLLLGNPLEEALRSFSLIDPNHLDLLLAGHETGRLEVYLLRLAGDLEGRVEAGLRQATRLLEPGVLLVLSTGIGGLALAYLMPMVRMLEQAGGY